MGWMWLLRLVCTIYACFPRTTREPSGSSTCIFVGSGGSTHRRVGSTRTAQYYGQAETAQPADDGGNGRAYSSSWDKIHSLQIKLRECMADKEEMRDALDEAGLREGALRHQLEQVGAKAKKNNATAWKQR